MSFEPAYCYGSKLRRRVGWEMYLGDDGQGGERWEPITGVRITGDRVLITVADGTTYATGYADAVRCRRPLPDRGPLRRLTPCGDSGSRRAGRTVP
jgi:hypothetical protein